MQHRGGPHLGAIPSRLDQENLSCFPRLRVMLLMMAPAKPPNFPRLLVVIVVRVRLWLSADLARSSNKQPAPQGGSNILVRQELEWVSIVPFHLRGRFARHAASIQGSMSNGQSSPAIKLGNNRPHSDSGT